MSNVFDIFPVPLYRSVLDIDTSALNNYKKNMYEVGTGAGMTQESPPRILEKPDLKHIKSEVLNHFRTFMYNYMGVPDQTDAAITTSWIVSIKKNGYIHVHKHTNCWFSGLLYFEDDYTDAVALDLRNLQQNNSAYCVDSQRYRSDSVVSIAPEKNLLIFFPSYIEHGSEIHTADKTRWSLAFNFFPIGKIGEITQDSYIDTAWLNS